MSVRKQEEEAGFLWHWHNESNIPPPDKRPTLFVVTDGKEKKKSDGSLLIS